MFCLYPSKTAEEGSLDFLNSTARSSCAICRRRSTASCSKASRELAGCIHAGSQGSYTGGHEGAGKTVFDEDRRCKAGACSEDVEYSSGMLRTLWVRSCVRAARTMPSAASGSAASLLADVVRRNMYIASSSSVDRLRVLDIIELPAASCSLSSASSKMLSVDRLRIFGMIGLPTASYSPSSPASHVLCEPSEVLRGFSFMGVLPPTRSSPSAQSTSEELAGRVCAS
mmetsp:Transcript_35243/g.109772  ORF Transcript_35243/g.109772 Transcript_35243/m.109772 type:complete len:227 (+) Transcript_35243:405-1085(+)